MTWPLVSPLRHSALRERLQKVACPLAAVVRSASALAKANMRTTPLAASWATTGTRPSASKVVAAIRASMFPDGMRSAKLLAREFTRTISGPRAGSAILPGARRTSRRPPMHRLSLVITLLATGAAVSGTAAAPAARDAAPPDSSRAAAAPAASDPLEQQIQRATRGALVKDCWLVPNPTHGYKENPCSLTADLDGDGKPDVAVLVKETKKPARRGVFLLFASGKHLVAGAGKKLGSGGDDFSWMDGWRVMPRSEARELWKSISNDALLVEDTNAAGGVLSLVAGKLRWTQWSD
jgi:hypothetical protein